MSKLHQQPPHMDMNMTSIWAKTLRVRILGGVGFHQSLAGENHVVDRARRSHLGMLAAESRTSRA